MITQRADEDETEDPGEDIRNFPTAQEEIERLERELADWKDCAKRIVDEYSAVLVYKIGKSTESSEALRRFKELGGKIYE